MWPVPCGSLHRQAPLARPAAQQTAKTLGLRERARGGRQARSRQSQTPCRARPGVLGAQRLPARADGVPARRARSDRSSAEAHNWLGVALSEKADLPGAIAAFRKAVALDPKYGRAYTNLGAALAKSGDFAEAVAVFQKALSLEPNSLAAHMNLGMALREKGDLDGALEHLRRVAAGDPDNAGIQYELGQTLRQSGDLAGADCGIREGARDRAGAARGLLRARAGAEAAERVRAQAAPSRRRAPRTIVYRRAQEAAGAWRPERRPRTAHRGPPPRRQPRGGAQPARFHPRPAGRSVLPRSLTWSARSRSGPNPPRLTTTSALRCGTAAPRTGRCPSCGKA